jgi:hypothetical protein
MPCCDRDAGEKSELHQLIYSEARRPKRFRARVETSGAEPQVSTGVNTFTFVVLLLAVAASGIEAQSADGRLSFEVASVKSDKSETGVDRIKVSKGSLILENVSLKRCIRMAHGIAEGTDYLLSGPDWLDSERFDIFAKFPPETNEHDLLLMLQGLLAERFNLVSHRETRQFSAYALVIGKGGPKLHPAAAPEGSYKFSGLLDLHGDVGRPAFSPGFSTGEACGRFYRLARDV